MSSSESWKELVNNLTKLNAALIPEEPVDEHSYVLIYESQSDAKCYSISSLVSHTLDRKPWSPQRVSSHEFYLKKREALLEHALRIHKAERESFSYLRLRVRNDSSSPIFRLPDDILLLIFLKCSEDTIAPELLAGVCHRWRGLTTGKIGSKLWSIIGVDVTHRAKVLNLAKRLTLFVERSNLSSQLIMRLSDPGKWKDVKDDDFALLRTIVLPCIRRTKALEVNNVDRFSKWFPLGLEGLLPTNLVRLRLTGPAWKTISGSNGHDAKGPFLFASCPSLRVFTLSTNSPLLEPVDALSSILKNLAANAPSLTRLDIEASDEIDSVYTVLSSFRKLEFLRWRLLNSAVDRSTVPPTEEPRSLEHAHATTLTLPRLRTLVLAGSPIMKAFAGSSAISNTQILPQIDAPALKTIHLSDFSASPSNTVADSIQDWSLICPMALFPTLQEFTATYPDWAMEKMTDMIALHSSSLKSATFVLKGSRLPSFFAALGKMLMLVAQPTSTEDLDGSEGEARLIQASPGRLQALCVACIKPWISASYAPSNYEPDIVYQLETLLIQRRLMIESLAASSALTTVSSTPSPKTHPSLTPPSTLPSVFGFKIRLSSDILESCLKVRTLVNANPDVLEVFEMPTPPHVDDHLV